MRGAHLVWTVMRRTLYVIAWILVVLMALLSTPVVNLYTALALVLVVLLATTHPWITSGVAVVVIGLVVLLCSTVHLDRRARSSAESLRS